MIRHRILFTVFQDSNKLLILKLFPLQSARCVTTVRSLKETFDNVVLENAKPFEQIPSMRMLPILGTAWTYLPIVGKYDLNTQHLAAFDKQHRFGNIFREKFGPINMVISFNPDDMQVLYQHEGPYPSRGEFSSMKAYRESRKQWYATTGLLVLQGKEWRDLRSKTQKHLMKPKAVQAYLHSMQDVAREFVDKMFKMRDNNKEVPNFLGELYKWSLESIALVGLDTRLGCFHEKSSKDSDGQKMIDSVQTMLKCMNKLESLTGNLPIWKFFPTPTWKKFTKVCDTFTEIAFKYINRSVEDLKKNAELGEKEMTLLQAMLATKDLDLSDAMVTVADMLSAGIDTTSHSVGFLLYHLARNSDKQELLHHEIIQSLPRKEDRITPNVFNELKYLKACMKESQRLHPIIGGMARSVDHDIVFSGYRIPAGTILIVGTHIMGMDENYFPNPNTFLPERWLDKENKIRPFSFAPFGIGPRSCIGRRLAEQEIICLMTEIVRNFKVEYHHEDIGIYTRLVNTPDRPLRYNFIER